MSNVARLQGEVKVKQTITLFKLAPILATKLNAVKKLLNELESSDACIKWLESGGQSLFQNQNNSVSVVEYGIERWIELNCSG